MLKKSINNFCGDYSLEESKDFLWEMLRPALCGSTIRLSRKERANLASFCDNLQGFLTSSFNNYNQSLHSESCLNPDQSTNNLENFPKPLQKA